MTRPVWPRKPAVSDVRGRACPPPDGGGLGASAAAASLACAEANQEQRAAFPLTLELPADLGLTKRAWVKISQVRTLSVERLGKRIARATPELLDQLIEGLSEIIAA